MTSHQLKLAWSIAVSSAAESTWNLNLRLVWKGFLSIFGTGKLLNEKVNRLHFSLVEVWKRSSLLHHLDSFLCQIFCWCGCKHCPFRWLTFYQALSMRQRASYFLYIEEFIMVNSIACLNSYSEFDSCQTWSRAFWPDISTMVTMVYRLEKSYVNKFDKFLLDEQLSATSLCSWGTKK